jgi:hypothetical protein
MDRESTDPSRQDTGSHAQDLVVVYAARTLPDAQQLRNRLAEVGIEAVVTNAVLEGGAGPGVVGWSTLARVAVAQKDAEAARIVAEEFDRTIGSASPETADDGAAGDRPPDRAPPWPVCPQCHAPRIARCPICETLGTDFVEADPDYLGAPIADEPGEPSACGCGAGPCSKTEGASEADGASGEPEGSPPEERGDALASPFARLPSEKPVEAPPSTTAEKPAPRTLICPTCDEPFVPTFSRVCEWCGHEFDDGYDPEPPPAEPITGRALAVIVGLGLLVIAVVVYFLVLL